MSDAVEKNEHNSDRAVLMELGAPIAAKLTAPQRRAVARFAALEPNMWLPICAVHRGSARVLIRYGLLNDRFAGMQYVARLTPLGLAVREALQQGGSDGRD